MIVSFKHRFIFIKTRKTAGTSIEIALSKYCGPDDILTPFRPEDERIRTKLGYRGPQNYREADFFNHMHASQVRERLDRPVWDSFFKFCFERNPWDKAISLYYWRYRSFRQFPGLLRLAGRGINQVMVPSITRMVSAYDMYSINGEVAVDFIGQYERLDQDLGYVASRLELPGSLYPLPQAKRNLRADTRRYREVLSPAGREGIAEACHRENELLGYRW